MANKRIKTPLGERPNPVHPSEYVKPLSSIDPLPFFPNLARQLRGPTNAIVLTYLEMLHPAPQDSNGEPTNDPVTIDCDQACEDLQISRRTLHIAFHCLCNWFSTEDARGRAERAGRAFINSDHDRYGSVKAYSVVGPKGWHPRQTVFIKRNLPRLYSIFRDAELSQLCLLSIESTLTSESPNSPILTASRLIRSLPSLLAGLMPDWGDRRAERWDRWRRENGKKSNNPGRMRGSKIGVTSTDVDVSD